MFNYKKAAQILAWLLRKYDGAASKILIIKLLYFADRYHLRKYGRTVSGDDYHALPNGPVASKTLNMANIEDNWLPPKACALASEYFELKNGGKTLTLIKNDEDQSSLSQTDIEALSFAYNTFGKYKPFDLVELTHKYPEWAQYRDLIRSDDNPKGEGRIAMDVLDFLKDPQEGLNPCYSMTEEDRQFIGDMVKESEEFEKFFK